MDSKQRFTMADHQFVVFLSLHLFASSYIFLGKPKNKQTNPNTFSKVSDFRISQGDQIQFPSIEIRDLSFLKKLLLEQLCLFDSALFTNSF